MLPRGLIWVKAHPPWGCHAQATLEALASTAMPSPTHHPSLHALHQEHATLSAVLRSLGLMLERGPGDDPEAFFDVLRAMLFYIDEFPERQHHPKESALLFAPLRDRVPGLRSTLDRLDAEHTRGEQQVRELQHLLLAWQLLGQSRRAAFEDAARHYQAFYLAHLRLEDTEVFPAALKHLTEADWARLDAAFAEHRDPLSAVGPREPLYDRLFTQIVMRAPAPIGLGPSSP